MEHREPEVTIGVRCEPYGSEEMSYRAIISILVDRLGGNVGISFEESHKAKMKHLSIFVAPHLNGATLVVHE